jgi:hypothetical protein
MDGTVVDEMEISLPYRQMLEVRHYFHITPDGKNDFRDALMPVDGISVDFLDFDPKGLLAAELDFLCEHCIYSLVQEDNLETSIT